MAGLNHDFLLLSTRENPYTDYMKWINHREGIRIHDDVMQYMQDTLKWITCYNPAQKMMKHKGLNFYGPTVIKKDGAVDAEKLFTTWATLFSMGPKRIKLTGSDSEIRIPAIKSSTGSGRWLNTRNQLRTATVRCACYISAFSRRAHTIR